MRDYDDILMHYEEPFHRGCVANPTHVHEEHNPACGDWIKYELIVVDGCIRDAWFEGGGCVISQSAASILTKHIEGKACDWVSREFSAEATLALFDCPLTTMRKQCCLLSWTVLKQALFSPVGD